MEMKISFPGNRRVAAKYDGFTVLTDQPVEAGGDGEAPAPFDLFLVSLGTCAGLFALSFCQKRGIGTKGLEVRQLVDWDEKAHHVNKITLEIALPEGFPEKYRDSIVAAAELCTVKQHLHDPPAFEIRARAPAATRAARA